MNKLLIAGAFLMLSTTAGAAETGVINQAGPYEATMRFYLHPAHGFPGKAESTEPTGSVADTEERSAAKATREAQKRAQPSGSGVDRPSQLATREAK